VSVKRNNNKIPTISKKPKINNIISENTQEIKIREYDKIPETNKLINKDFQFPLNLRRITNIGTFRAYIECYLKNNKQIHNSLTFLVRQLAPSENGIPIEIYVFTNDQKYLIEFFHIQSNW
jgi:hypothetical protein